MKQCLSYNFFLLIRKVPASFLFEHCQDVDHLARGREIRLRGSGEFYQRNGTADFRAVSLRWRESFGRGRRLTVGGYFLPSYYLRQLHDEDYVPPLPGLSLYRRAEFSLGIGSIAWRQRLSRRLRGEAGYQFEHRGYNADFDERTSNTHQGELSLEWFRLPRRGSVEVRSGYRKSLARAYDSDLIANDDPDVSYHGLLAGASGRMDFTRRRAGRLSGGLDYEYATRDYESDRVADKSHYRRNDHRHTVEASIQCELPADVTARAFYRLEDNSARFPAGAGPSGDPASYTENQVGLAIDWSTVLWKSARAPSPPDDEAP